nr:caspase family protein [uncultured Rhodoferax sp.]
MWSFTLHYLSRRRLVRSLRMGIAAAALYSFSASAVAPLDIRVALVIGNSAYAGSASLDNPANDATAMAAALKRLGFTVIQLRDGSRTQMLDAIRSLGDSLRATSGVGVLYYAGHGLQLDWRNYMVPVNATLSNASEVQNQAVDLDVVLQTFKTAGSRMNIVILDACRDNPFTATTGAKGLAQMDAPPGTFLAYATAPGNVAEDGSVGSNGLYTGFLLRELTRPAAKIEDVFKRVRLQVRQSSKGRQVPWESTSLEEDFVFNDGIKHTLKAEDLDQLRQAGNARQQEYERAVTEAKATARLSKEQAAEETFKREKADWDRIANSRNPDDFYGYLLRYPSGSISELASAALERLEHARITHVPDKDGMVQVSGRDRFRMGDKHYFTVRDELTKTNRFGLMEVTKVNEDTVEVNQGQDLYTREGAGIRNRHIARMDPPRLEVPASEYIVGKRWNYRLNQTTASGQASGVPQVVHGTARVVALEEVSIPAGHFKAYRVELDEFSQEGTHVKLTRWMLPSWGFPIKMKREVRRRFGGPELETMEMTFKERVGG